VVSARAVFVDAGLDDDASLYHGCGAGVETTCDLFDGRKVDPEVADSRIDKKVKNGDKNEECKGVEVGEDVIGDTIQPHDSCLRGQVVVDLLQVSQ
jgi:hypothetical protein